MRVLRRGRVSRRAPDGCRHQRGALPLLGPYSADLTVEGMHCEHCLAAVETALDGIGGVWARASLPDHVRVLSKDPIDHAALIEAVESAGYRVVG